jgi:uncharacterized damage-inducible protein DinB
VVSNNLAVERERIETSWSALDQVIRALSDDQLTMLIQERWSIKDHLAHMALAEQYCRAGLLGQPPHVPLGVDPQTLLGSSEDELNELCYQQTKGLSTTQVLTLRSTAHTELLDALAAITDSDLDKAFAPYGEPLGMTLRDILRGNTYEHYELHRSWIEKMAASKDTRTE